MTVERTDVMPIAVQNDIVFARQRVREWCIQQKFSLVAQTKMVTAASELARNTLDYGKGGTMTLKALSEGSKIGLCLVFEDKGPGIADMKLALTDGYTTGGGLGLGLSGSKRLVNDFSIESSPGEGTRVSITMWK